MDLVQKEHGVELAKVTKACDEAVAAFAALERSSDDEAKQLKIDRANADTRTERLQAAITEATVKIIGKLLRFIFSTRCGFTCYL